jgi:hypothetical protein
MKPNSLNIAYTVAAVSIVLFLLGAIIEGGMMLSFLLGAAAFIALVVVPLIFIRKERLQSGGLISFKEAFMLSFTGLLAGGFISVAFTYVYVNFIDTEYVTRMTYKTMEFTKNLMEGSAPEDQMEEALRKIEADMESGFSLLGILKSFGIYILFYALISAVLAAFLKKEDEGFKSTIESNTL